ncbi:MAG: hypothetical protein ACK5M0_03545 [Bacteroidales bacterium]|jgi:hypothetical protein
MDNSVIIMPHDGITLIEKKLISLNIKTSRPTIRKALKGMKTIKAMEDRYRIIRTIALELGGAEKQSK